MEQRTIIIVVVVVALLACCCVVGVVLLFGGSIAAIFSATAPLTETGDAYFNAWKSGDSLAAYGLLHPSYQNSIGAPEDMASTWEVVVPAEWSYTSRSLNNDEGTLEGKMTDTNGITWDFKMELKKGAERWLITDFYYYYP